MFYMKIFYKHSIASGIHTHYLKMFLKYLLSNVLTTLFQKRIFLHIFLKYLLNIHLQTLANKEDVEQLIMDFRELRQNYPPCSV